MNTENLKLISTGQMFKNYIKLCEFLGEPKKDGKSKVYQINDWKRYFDFKKVGQKIIITDLYTIPLPKSDKRIKGNNSIYLNDIELLLPCILKSKETPICKFTKKNLLLRLGLVNYQYYEYQKSIYELLKSRYSNYKFYINHFYQRVNQKVDRTLFDSLNNIKNRGLIDYWKEYVIIEPNTEDRIANKKEIKLIKDAHKKALEEMGIDNEGLVFLKFKGDEFYKHINSILFELYGWHHVYQHYSFIYTVKEDIEVLSYEEISRIKSQLNNKIINFIDHQAHDKFNANQKILMEKTNDIILNWGGESISNYSNELFDFGIDYIDAQLDLSNRLLKI